MCAPVRITCRNREFHRVRRSESCKYTLEDRGTGAPHGATPPTPAAHALRQSQCSAAPGVSKTATTATATATIERPDISDPGTLAMQNGDEDAAPARKSPNPDTGGPVTAASDGTPAGSATKDADSEDGEDGEVADESDDARPEEESEHASGKDAVEPSAADHGEAATVEGDDTLTVEAETGAEVADSDDGEEEDPDQTSPPDTHEQPLRIIE